MSRHVCVYANIDMYASKLSMYVCHVFTCVYVLKERHLYLSWRVLLWPTLVHTMT